MKKDKYNFAIACILSLSVLYAVSIYNYLLFHSLAEIFGIVIACGIFMFAWNSRRIMNNNYLLFLGIAYLFIGFLDLLHALAYLGMGVFTGYGANLPTQLWIAARYIESLSLVTAPFFIDRHLRVNSVFVIYSGAILLLILSIFSWRVFPDCFVEGTGLTSFKKISEYCISLILAASIFYLYRKKYYFDGNIIKLLTASIILTIASEMAFTLYTDVYGLSNLAGHYLKIISFYLIYKAVIQTGLSKPYDLIFRELKEANEKLERSNEDLKQFTHIASHDLKSPLISIAGYVSILKDDYRDQLDSKGQKYIDFIVNSVGRMEKLIRDLLIYARIGTSSDDLKPVDMNKIYHFVINNLIVEVNERGATVTKNELPTVTGTGVQLEQLLQNLIGNAIKFHSQDPPRVHVSAVQHDGNWVFSVKDNGIGVAPEHQDTIFNMFERLHRGKYDGSGIGLAVCKKIVNQYGGRIWVESDAVTGSTFYFTMPTISAG